MKPRINGRTAAGLLALTAACAEPVRAPPSTARLRAVPPTIVDAGRPMSMDLLEEGLVPGLALTMGRLPTGMALDKDGHLSGTPTAPGERSTFDVEARSPDDLLLEQRTYTVVVSAPEVQSDPPPVEQKGKVVTFEHTWPQPVDRVLVWDDALKIAWPLGAEALLSGSVLASIDGRLSLHVAGPGWSGRFDYSLEPIDADTSLVAQLAWAGKGDLDLRLVDIGSAELSQGSPEWNHADGWVGRHALSAVQAPGSEALVLTDRLAKGRYALIATKADGTGASFIAQLGVRLRSGEVLAERQQVVLLSDRWTGPLADERSLGRQSWAALGIIERGDDRWTFVSPGWSGDPFEGEPIP